MVTFWEVLQDYQAYALGAFLVTVFLTPLAMRVAHRYGVLDVPDRELKPHARPTPYLGGTAIALAWAVALVLALLRGTCDWDIMLPLLFGGLAMSVLGLVDDVCHLSPKTRLLVGAIVIGVVVSFSGVGTQLVDVFAHPIGIHLPRVISMPLSVLLATMLVLGACNSTNLIDGLDGLCSGVTAIISLGFFLLAAHLAAWGFSEQGDPVRLVLASAMFGAAMGFLPWNFNPARIFMGDAGSVLLGYNCGMLILLFAERGGIMRWVVGALMIFALPVFDTALAMFRRWRAGRSIFEGDRSHFYDQLVQRGFSVRTTVLISYALTLIYAGVGLLMTWVRNEQPVIRTRYALLLYVLVVLFSALAAWRCGLTHPEQKRGD